MITVLGYLLFVAALATFIVHVYRHYVLHKESLPNEQIPFDGSIYRLGDIVVAKRRSHSNYTKTVVCMPGFMETMTYFFDLYKDEEVELIFVNNCAYHSPVNVGMSEAPSWFNASNPFVAGTIEHDAVVIAQVVENMITTDNVILHGHSRGGAVILESSKYIAKKNKHFSAVLEAPVLPQGKARGHQMPKLMRILVKYYMPLAFHYYRDNALAYLRVGGYRFPATDIKERIISEYFSNPKQYKTTITNIESIDRWTESTGYDIYDNFDDISVLVPQKDIVLDRKAMYKSAASGKQVKIVVVDAADHFISLERPEFVLQYIHSLFESASSNVKEKSTAIPS